MSERVTIESMRARIRAKFAAYLAANAALLFELDAMGTSEDIVLAWNGKRLADKIRNGPTLTPGDERAIERLRARRDA